MTENNDTLVSIVMPSYNCGTYIEASIRSVLAQTYTEWELIVVDDGSTDGSEQILQRYQQQYPHFSYYNQPNRGQSAARNEALKHARGEYIYFMDSDDKVDTDMLRQCYEYAEQTQADFIFFDGDKQLDEGAHDVSWNYRRTHLLEEDKRYDGEALLNLMLDTRKHNCVVWLLFIRRDFLERIGLRFHEGIIHEDELFTTILTLSSHNVYCLQRTFVSHRIRRTSTMGISYSERNINCYLTVADELLRFSKAPIIHKFLRYTLSKVFYTGHLIPFKDKPAVFWRALRSGYLKYIGLKSSIVFWVK
jgi:glycosyltransferase involved in cell wall biosynthesis